MIQLSVLEGTRAIRNLLVRFLEKRQPRYTLGIPAAAPSMLGPFLERYHNDRIKLGIPVYHLYHAATRERAEKVAAMKHTFVRLLPPSFTNPVSTMICGDEVAITQYSEKPVTIHIQNQEVAQAYRKYFELLWGCGTEI